MPLTLDENNAKYQIKAYQPGKIQVNELLYQRSIIIAPYILIEDWRPNTISELNADDLAHVITLKPSILLIGTGENLVFPPVEIYGNLINEGIGVEVMDTRAACRTYNALTAEDRNVVAALIIT